MTSFGKLNLQTKKHMFGSHIFFNSFVKVFPIYFFGNAEYSSIIILTQEVCLGLAYASTAASRSWGATSGRFYHGVWDR